MAGYRDYLTEQGLAERTIDLYDRRICALAGIVGGCEQLMAIAGGELTSLVAAFPNTPSTRRQIRTALKHYWEYKGRHDPPVKAIRVPRAPRGRFNGLTEDQARDIVKTAMGWQPQGLAVLFGMYMALRREEIAQVRWDRFTPDFDWYRVHGKANTIHDLPVHPVLQSELRPHGYVWAFPGRQGGHVTPATVWNWVREVADTAGIGTIHPHQLRHTAIATVNDNLGDLRAAQSFARHARPETTAIYTRTTSERLVTASLSLDYL